MRIAPGFPAYPFTTDGVTKNAPSKSGVYAICNARGSYVYFGDHGDIQGRLTEHLQDRGHAMHRYGAAFFAYEVLEHPIMRMHRRNDLIKAFPTPFNPPSTPPAQAMPETDIFPKKARKRRSSPKRTAKRPPKRAIKRRARAPKKRK